MVNYLSVLIAAIAGMIVGMIWYHPKVLGTTWMKMVKIKASDMKSGGPMMVIALIAQLIMAYVIAHLIDITGSKSLDGGIGIASLAWLGFVATVGIGIVLWEKKPVKLFLLNSLHWLVSMNVMSIVLTSWP